MSNLLKLKDDIVKRHLPNFLIFTGSEWKVQELYIDEIAKQFSNKYYADSFDSIYHKLCNSSIFSQANLYIVRDDKLLMNNEKLLDRIDGGLLGRNVLILLISSVDKRTKFYKRYKDSLIEFLPLESAVLRRYIKREIDLSDDNCTLLSDMCENDYGRVLLEIDKIKQYAMRVAINKSDINWDCYFKRLIEDGTIYRPPYDAIFDLVDAILNRKVNLSFDLLQQSYDMGESTLVMLTVLYNNTKAVLQVQSCKNSDIAKTTGLTGWQIKNAKKYLKKYSIGELVDMLRLIQKVEFGIKVGKIEEPMAMPYLLSNVL